MIAGTKKSFNANDKFGKSERVRYDLPKETSPIVSVPLLQPGSIEEFINWETAWINYVEAAHPTQGRCFRLNSYKTLEAPTMQNSADKLAMYPTEKSRAEALTNLLNRHFNAMEDMETERIKLFGLLLSVCSKRSRLIIENSSSTVLERGDVLELWRIISATHKTGTHNMTAMEASRSLQRQYATARQMPREGAAEFATRFRRIVQAYCESIPNEARPNEAAQAYQYCAGLDPARNPGFRLFMFNEERARPGEARLPETIHEAVAMAERFGDDGQLGRAAPRASYANQGAIAYSTDVAEDWVTNAKCYGCGRTGHLKKDCPERKEKEKKKKKNQEKSNKRHSASDQKVFKKTEEADSSIAEVEEIEMLMGDVDISSYANIIEDETGDQNKEDVELILDTGSTHHIIADSILLHDLEKSPQKYIIKGLTGKNTSMMIGQFGTLGEAVYFPDGKRNLISLGRLLLDKNCTVKFNEQQFVIKSPGQKDLIFFLNRKGLYVHTLKYVDAYVIETSSDRIIQFGQRDIRNAEKAREIEKIMGYVSPGNLAYATRQGGMTSFGVTGRDIANAEYIFGTDIARAKGKSTRARMKPNLLPIEGEKCSLRHQQIHCDIFSVEGKWFMLSVMSPLGQMFVSEVSTRRTQNSMQNVMKKHIGLCESHGFRITHALVDQEPGLLGLVGQLQDTVVVPVAKGQHVHRAERNIRWIKDRARAIIASLPYTLPMRCIPYLISFVVQRINVLPRSSLGPIAPNELFTGKQFDFKKDGKAGFGEFVIAPEPDTDNTMKERARICITMGPRSNLSQNWLLLDVDKGTIISRADWKQQVITEDMITKLNLMANEDAMNSRGETRLISSAEDTPIADPDRLEGLPALDTIVGTAPILAEDTTADDVHHDTEPETTPIRRSERLQGKHVNTYVCNTYNENSEIVRSTIEVIGLHMFIGEATRKYGRKSDDSAESELREILDRKVFTPVSKHDAHKDGIKIVKSFLFFKEKLRTDGSLEKLKARLVAMETEGDPDQKTSSPTVRLESLMMILSIAGAEKRDIRAFDVGNAFLEADMKEEDPIIVEFDRMTTQKLIRLQPDMEQYITQDGKLYGRLQKALYGCKASALLWNQRLTQTLTNLSFKQNKFDRCVFNRDFNGEQLTVAIYVDDILCTCKNIEAINWMETELKREFKKVKKNEKESLTYLSLEIDINEEYIKISMKKYIESVLEEWIPYSDNKICSTPALKQIMERSDKTEKLPVKDRELFHRTVARLLFLAKRIAPDLLLAVSVLSSRVRDPDKMDMVHLQRVLAYLKGSRNRAIVFKAGGNIDLCQYTDASFGVHEKMKSRTGSILFLNGGFVGAWSSKQKLNSKSSTEAELIGITDDIGWGLWAKHWLREQGYDVKLVIFQDNTSVKKILERGPEANGRTRHLAIRYYFISDLLERQEVSIDYCPTENMKADGLTKPLIGDPFRRFRDGIITVTMN
jgi:hypothetical protein